MLKGLLGNNSGNDHPLHSCLTISKLCETRGADSPCGPGSKTEKDGAATQAVRGRVTECLGAKRTSTELVTREGPDSVTRMIDAGRSIASYMLTNDKFVICTPNQEMSRLQVDDLAKE